MILTIGLLLLTLATQLIINIREKISGAIKSGYHFISLCLGIITILTVVITMAPVVFNMFKYDRLMQRNGFSYSVAIYYEDADEYIKEAKEINTWKQEYIKFSDKHPTLVWFTGIIEDRRDLPER